MQMLEDGRSRCGPGLPGCARSTSRVKLVVCSTSNERAVNTLVRTLLGADVHGWFDMILAGDVVTRKKPSPEIYQMALERLALDPADCVVIEDSRNGLLAAKGAGLACLITHNDYTRDEDFSEADLVVDCLGEPQGPPPVSLHPVPSSPRLSARR